MKRIDKGGEVELCPPESPRDTRGHPLVQSRNLLNSNFVICYCTTAQQHNTVQQISYQKSKLWSIECDFQKFQKFRNPYNIIGE